MTGPLTLDREAIGELCQNHGARRLVLFGSAVSEQLDDPRSDVDFLVEFGDNVTSQFDAYFGLEEGLDVLLGRPVDWSCPVLSIIPTLQSPSPGTPRNSMRPDTGPTV